MVQGTWAASGSSLLDEPSAVFPLFVDRRVVYGANVLLDEQRVVELRRVWRGSVETDTGRSTVILEFSRRRTACRSMASTSSRRTWADELGPSGRAVDGVIDVHGGPSPRRRRRVGRRLTAWTRPGNAKRPALLVDPTREDHELQRVDGHQPGAIGGDR